MNHCAIQQNAFSTREEIRSTISASMSDRRDPVFCPKPRRLGLFNTAFNDQPVRSFRLHRSHQPELCDSKAGTDLLDIILTKGGYGVEQTCTQVASSPLFFCGSPPMQVPSSPPFFCGSPPSRVANPLIQDARFGDEKLPPLSALMPITPPSGLSSSPASSSSSSSRKGGCIRSNFGNKPAVRIEGFDCLDRDCRNCSIPALA